MRWKIIILYLLFGLFGGLIWNYSYLGTSTPAPIKVVNAVAKQIITIPSFFAVPRVGLPQTMIIPKLGINAAIEEVGQDTSGRMDIPKQPENVAWYALGPRPGEVGSAVLAGHLDTDAAPAVFAHLKELTLGDTIEIIDSRQHLHTFVVTQIEHYDDSEFPLALVFSRSDKSRLNLITCEGRWNSKKQTYSKRLVVFGEEKK